MDLGAGGAGMTVRPSPAGDTMAPLHPAGMTFPLAGHRYAQTQLAPIPPTPGS